MRDMNSWDRLKDGAGNVGDIDVDCDAVDVGNFNKFGVFLDTSEGNEEE